MEEADISGGEKDPSCLAVPCSDIVVSNNAERTLSDYDWCDEFFELERVGVEPLTLDDITFNNSYELQEDLSNEEFSFDPTKSLKIFSMARAESSKRKKKTSKLISPAKCEWRKALNLIKDRRDPWGNFHLDQIKSEKGRRHRYNPLTQTWVVDECILKMDKEPFAEGAMRECFRMKKLSNFSMNNDWSRDSNNFVAKSYMDEATPRETYFEDVKMQMDSKVWAEEYNRHNPPKKVDMFMMGVVELVEQPGAPLYHIEHYIEGEYVKYNSNFGFVEDTGKCRQTPQALSHFTFERSGHELVVVDIQGVGDLYTDPQIHTASGLEYGDGNLGIQGMALFFQSHHCNKICHSLGLTPFDLSPNEVKQLEYTIQRFNITSETKVKMDDSIVTESPSEKPDFGRFCQGISGSLESTSDYFSQASSRQISECDEAVMFPIDGGKSNNSSSMSSSIDSGLGKHMYERTPRTRGITECERDPEHQIKIRQKLDKVASRPSSVSAENARKLSGLMPEFEESVLGFIHLDMVMYHETDRYDANVQDTDSAHFHLKAAADCGNQLALVAISSLYLGLPNDILPCLDNLDVSELVPDNIEDHGLDYMVSAAHNGDVNSILFLARAFDCGQNLGNDRSQSYGQALDWYQMAIEMGVDKRYLILARMAEIMLMEDSGCKDPNRAGELYSEAAKAATEQMCGKLANKYYMLSEEAWAFMEV